MSSFFQYRFRHSQNDKWRKICAIILAFFSALIVFIFLKCLAICFSIAIYSDSWFIGKWDESFYRFSTLFQASIALFSGVYVYAEFLLNRPSVFLSDKSRQKKNQLNNARFFYWGFIHFFLAVIAFFYFGVCASEGIRLVSPAFSVEFWLTRFFVILCIWMLAARVLKVTNAANSLKETAVNYLLLAFFAVALNFLPIGHLSQIRKSVENSEYSIIDSIEIPASHLSEYHWRYSTCPELFVFPIDGKPESDTLGILMDQEFHGFKNLRYRIRNKVQSYEESHLYRSALYIGFDSRLSLNTIVHFMHELEYAFPATVIFASKSIDAENAFNGFRSGTYHHHRRSTDLKEVLNCNDSSIYQWHSYTKKGLPPPPPPPEPPPPPTPDNAKGMIEYLAGIGWEDCHPITLEANGDLTFGTQSGNMDHLDEFVATAGFAESSEFCIAHFKISTEVSWGDCLLLRSKMSQIIRDQKKKEAICRFGVKLSDLTKIEQRKIKGGFKMGPLITYCPNSGTIALLPFW